MREQPERQIVAGTWDTVMRAGGTLEDTVFFRPTWMRATPDGRVFVVDDITQELVALDRRGRVLWRYGGEGGGPGEFAAIRDLALGPDGNVHLLDADNRRITVVDTAGRRITGIPLAEEKMIPAPEELVPLSDGTYVVLSGVSDTPITHLDERGELLGRASMPWPRFAELHPLASQGTAAADIESDRWVYALNLADGWIPFRGRRDEGRMFRYVEHTPLPEVECESTSEGRMSRLADYVDSANGAVLSGSALYVLFGGRSEWAGALVDRYSFTDGGYTGSFALPTAAQALAVADSIFFVATWHPYPGVVGLRPDPGWPTQPPGEREGG